MRTASTLTLFVMAITSACVRPEQMLFETPPGTRPRFAVDGDGLHLALCYADVQGTVFYQPLEPDGQKRGTPVAIIHGLAGDPVMSCAARETALVVGVYDASDRTIRLAQSRDKGTSWRVGVVNGVPEPRGPHRLVFVGEDLLLVYSAGDAGAVMQSVVDLQQEPVTVRNVRVVDDDATSRGGEYLSVHTVADTVVLVYSGAYDGPGRGRSLVTATIRAGSTTNAEAEVVRVDGPACSVGNHAAAAVSDGKVFLLAADSAAVRLYRPAAGGTERITLAEAASSGRVSASALASSGTGTSLVAAVQQWPVVTTYHLAMDGLIDTKVIELDRRATAEVPVSDLELVKTRDGLMLVYFDPRLTRIRAVPAF